MINNEEFRKIAVSFPEVEELPHFEKKSFRIRKRIFATLNEKENRGCVKLSENDQYIFSKNESGAVYPVPNKWGLHGWTNIDLKRINKRLLKEIMKSAYAEVKN
ncbi:MAG TPA: MmcQ/YjbR family DNA-binding protein [Ignavibacteria bacterium]|nr:MmcQ/YjbR family DNA-binding protein [Ignavibacteria bacterium]HMR41602.1 MmcQ/YjbR family DNA-binding protein [Ignavibacteria bacterium]